MNAEAIVVDEPVWFERLRAPRWLLPATPDGAPRVFIACADLSGTGDDPSLGTGAAMMVAEALRFSSDAAISVATSPVTQARLQQMSSELDADFTVAMAISAEDEGYRLWMRLAGREGEAVADLGGRASDDAALATALSDVPGALGAALAERGIARTWAPVFAIPEAASDYARAHRTCRELEAPELYPQVDDVEIKAARRTIQVALLTELSDLAQRSRSRSAALLYMAGLAAVRDAGSDAHLEFRLQTNALCMKATDPRDVVFRMSVLALRLQGDVQIAERRAEALRASNDAALTEWLGRAQAVR